MLKYSVKIEMINEDGNISIGQRTFNYDRNAADCSLGWNLGIDIGLILLGLRHFEGMLDEDYRELAEGILDALDVSPQAESEA